MVAQPAADTSGTHTIVMATVFGRNLKPSGPPTYAPIGRTYPPPPPPLPSPSPSWTAPRAGHLPEPPPPPKPKITRAAGTTSRPPTVMGSPKAIFAPQNGTDAVKFSTGFPLLSGIRLPFDDVAGGDSLGPRRVLCRATR